MGLVVVGSAYVGTFHVRFSGFSLGSFGALCKISHVKIFKSYCAPSFHQTYGNQGEYRVLPFRAICQIYKILIITAV